MYIFTCWFGTSIGRIRIFDYHRRRDCDGMEEEEESHVSALGQYPMEYGSKRSNGHHPSNLKPGTSPSECLQFDRNDNIISKDWDWLNRLEDKLEGEKDLDFHCGSRAQKWMKDAGFANIRVFEYYWPFGGESEPTVEGREFGVAAGLRDKV